MTSIDEASRTSTRNRTVSTRSTKKIMTDASYEDILKERMDEMRSVLFEEALENAKAKVLEQQQETIPNCAICQDTMKLPLKVCRNGDHHVCAECLSGMFRNTEVSFHFTSNNEHMCIPNNGRINYIKCPLCNDRNDMVNKEDIILDLNPTNKCTFLYSLLPDAGKRMKCKHCDFVGEGLDRAHHALVCSENRVACKFCTKTCHNNDINTHLANECSKLPCRFCLANSTLYTAAELRAHNYIHSHHSYIREQIIDFTQSVAAIIYDSEAGHAMDSNNVPIDEQDLQNHAVFYNILRQYTPPCTSQSHRVPVPPSSTSPGPLPATTFWKWYLMLQRTGVGETTP